MFSINSRKRLYNTHFYSSTQLFPFTATNKLYKQSFSTSSLWEKFKNLFIFFPNAPDFIQYQNKSPVKGIQGYRYPSPGDRGASANIPEGLPDPYDTTSYDKDTTRHRSPIYIATSSEISKAIGEDSSTSKKQLNPPKNIPQVLGYDPSGIRVAATTSQEAVEAKIKDWRPTHLPAPWWYHAGIDDYETYSKPRGLPPRAGKPLHLESDRPVGNW